jgi:DNA-binding SARP family transcriptional activator/energy-coupling factor transporter ATP-binding protein EcfA2
MESPGGTPTYEGERDVLPGVVPRARMRPPQVRALPRERLLRSLAAAGDHRLVLVTGPAGCGKTTLLAQYTAGLTEPTAWYRLDAGDRREATLLGHLAQALASVVASLDADAGAAWSSAEEAADTLERVSAERVVLALDDLHVVAGTPAEAALGRLVELAPPWLVVAATCRQAPAWNLSRLRVSGALGEIGPDDLRFRSWEVERLFADVYGEPLPPADLARLARGLEGWAAGLQLFHLATRGKHTSERRRAVAALPARSKLIREYLSGNVLDELPDDQRDFLIDTSVLGRLSPALCNGLRERHDALRLLAELEARQVFVTRLDEDEPVYRYHEVFRAYLETRLVERDGERQAKEWGRRAAALLEDGGWLMDALRAFCWSGDWASVGRVVATGGAELADDEKSWLDWLPAGLVEEDPWVMMATARRAAASGRLAVALDLYQRAESLAVGTAARDICGRERAAIVAWLDPAAPDPSGWPGRLRAVVRSRPVQALAERTNGAALALGGSIVGAAVVAEVDPEPGSAEENGAVEQVGAALVAAVGAALAGRLGEAAQLFGALTDDPAAPLPLAAAARLALTAVHALAARPLAGELDDLAELVELADGEGRNRAIEVADECEAQGDPWGGVAGRFLAVLGSLATGDAPVGELVGLCDRLRRLEAGAIECWCRAWLATAMARAGDSRALEVARAAERDAAVAEVPGAQVWAIMVQAELVPGDEARELAARADTLRFRWGVDVPVLPAGVTVAAVAPRSVRDSGPGLRVRCLGRFQLELDGRPVDVSAVKPRARSALHLLAAHGGRPVHAESMVEALWPDLDAAAGKRNLQVAVSSVRRLLDDHRSGGGALVRREGPAYVLALPDVSCADVAVFAAARDEAREAARSGDEAMVLDAGERALVAYGGDLLPEDGPADWVVELRRQAAADAAEVALLVAETALGVGSHDVAAAACARGLDIDRYHDGLWRLLVDAQERTGDLAAATRSNERYHAMLRELGVGVSDQALA